MKSFVIFFVALYILVSLLAEYDEIREIDKEIEDLKSSLIISVERNDDESVKVFQEHLKRIQADRKALTGR